MNFEEVVVLDTNVLIERPRAIFDFPNFLVVIPRVVLEELDGLKNSNDGNVRRTSRATSWLLDDITEQNEEMDSDVMLMDNGGFLKIDGNYFYDDKYIMQSDLGKPDNKIISIAVKYANEGEKVTFYTNDTNPRVMARDFAKQYGIPLKSRKYLLTDETLNEMDSGVQKIFLPCDEFLSVVRKHSFDKELPYINGEHLMIINEATMGTKLAKYDAINKKVIFLQDYKKGEPIWRIGSGNENDNVRPIDSLQTFMADDILDTTKELHFVLSKVAGAGKNFIATACALNLLKAGEYDRLLVVKPMIEVDGEKTGFLPGTKEEKIAPFFDSFKDTMYELTCDGQSRNFTADLEARIELDIVTHMRGRTIPKAIMIIDEAQNFSEEAIKTLLTRIGKDAKVILMGDLSQIDNPRLDASNCGLRVWAERARRQEVGYGKSTYIMLEGNFRSDLSAWASSFYE